MQKGRLVSKFGLMDGLPPLPKSLSGLLNFSRESLSRAEASLGLRPANGQPAGPAGPGKPGPQAKAAAGKPPVATTSVVTPLPTR